MKAEIGKSYKHYKNNNEYVVIAIGRHTETLEEMVVYEAQYDDAEFGSKAVWIRPRKIFEEKLVIDGVEVDRFVAL